MSKFIWLNTKILPAEKAKISVLDRGFLYGDGVYETVRLYSGHIFRAEQHWKRLDNSLKGISLPIPWAPSQITNAILKTVKKNKTPECLARITISRGVGEIGYDPTTSKKPTGMVLTSPIRPDLPKLSRTGVKIIFASVRRNHPRSLNPALKHTNCLNGILAKMEALKESAFEAVFLNLEGEIAEGTISNFFLIKNGTIKTPRLGCGILEGVTRGATLEVAKKEGFDIKETSLSLADAERADEMFITSTTMEVMPVVQAGSKKVGKGLPGPITRQLQEKLRFLIQSELKLIE